jgi:hypothetical protein
MGSLKWLEWNIWNSIKECVWARRRLSKGTDGVFKAIDQVFKAIDQVSGLVK